MSTHVPVPDINSNVTLRNVKIKGTAFRIHTWMTNSRFSTGQEKIGYAFYNNDTLIFSGEDCGVSPMHRIDSNDAIAGLLGFLSRRPGGADPEYFDSYTPEQLNFANAHGEELSMYVYDFEEESRDVFEDVGRSNVD